MEAFIGFSALYFMPLYAFGFIIAVAEMLKEMKKEEPSSNSLIGTGIFFALMMWTISSSIYLGSE